MEKFGYLVCHYRRSNLWNVVLNKISTWSFICYTLPVSPWGFNEKSVLGSRWLLAIVVVCSKPVVPKHGMQNISTIPLYVRGIAYLLIIIQRFSIPLMEYRFTSFIGSRVYSTVCKGKNLWKERKWWLVESHTWQNKINSCNIDVFTRWMKTTPITAH